MNLDEVPGRLELHKKLGTYHFDTESKIVDFEYFGRIEMPDDWWEKGLQLVLLDTPVRLTSCNLIEQSNNVSKSVDRQTLIKDLESSNAPLNDPWFDRYAMGNSNPFAAVNNFLKVKAPALRVAEQKYLQQVPLHIDHEQNQLVSVTNQDSDDLLELCADRGASKKFIIALHDVNPDTILAWGNSIIGPLKRGDVISWKYGTPHCTVNFNKESRFLLSVTGEIDRQDYITRFNYDYTDKNAYPIPRYESVCI